MTVTRKLVTLSGLLCLGVPVLAGAQTSVSKDAEGRMAKVTACLPGPVVVKGGTCWCLCFAGGADGSPARAGR